MAAKDEKTRRAAWQPATQLVHEGTLRSGFGETSEAIFVNSGYVYYSAEQAEAQSNFVSAKNTLLLQTRLARQQSRTAYLDVVSGISQVRALKQALDSSNIALAATQAGFDVGTRTSVDVLLSLRETYRAERDYARSRYDYLLNKLRLKQAAGLLKEDDIFEINRWFIQP